MPSQAIGLTKRRELDPTERYSFNHPESRIICQRAPYGCHKIGRWERKQLTGFNDAAPSIVLEYLENIDRRSPILAYVPQVPVPASQRYFQKVSRFYRSYHHGNIGGRDSIAFRSVVKIC